MIKKTFLVLATALLVGACNAYSPTSQSVNPSPAATGQATQSDFTISNFTFSPASATVKAGQTVTITNNDSVPHTFTSDDGKTFDVGPINPGSSATMTAPVSGTYAFHCKIHPTMKGTLVTQ